MYNKQVDKSHYRFSKYVHKKRWLSMWHQVDEVLALQPGSLLEFGPGPGIFKLLATHIGISVETVDLDPELNPDHVASADDLPFDDNTYDCVCAFQMLEHLPYEQALQAFREMTRVAKRHVVLSLPDAQRKWVYSFHIPKVGQKIIHIPRPRKKIPVHEFDGEHYWEINKKGYPLQKILDDFSQQNITLLNTYRVPEYPYHRFLVYAKNNAGGSKS